MKQSVSICVDSCLPRRSLGEGWRSEIRCRKSEVSLPSPPARETFRSSLGEDWRSVLPAITSGIFFYGTGVRAHQLTHDAAIAGLVPGAFALEESEYLAIERNSDRLYWLIGRRKEIVHAHEFAGHFAFVVHVFNFLFSHIIACLSASSLHRKCG